MAPASLQQTGGLDARDPRILEGLLASAPTRSDLQNWTANSTRLPAGRKVGCVCRTRGYGVGLLEAAESGFTRAGLSNVSLQLARNNDAGRRFYRARGYAERARYELLDKVLNGAAKAPAPS